MDEMKRKLDRIIGLLEELLEKKTVRKRAAAPKIGANEVIAAYVDAYVVRYRTKPIIDSRAACLLKSVARDLSVGRACDIVQAYLQMNDSWFQTKCHDVPTLWTNLTKVAAALDTGRENPGKKELRELLEEEHGIEGVRKVHGEDGGSVRRIGVSGGTPEADLSGAPKVP